MFRNNLEYHNTELECSNYQSFVRRGLISRGDFLFRFNLTVIACYVLFLRHHGMGIRDGENYTKLQTPNLFVVVNGVVYFFITECHNSENYRMPWDSFSTTHSGEVTSRQWRLVRRCWREYTFMHVRYTRANKSIREVKLTSILHENVVEKSYVCRFLHADKILH